MTTTLPKNPNPYSQEPSPYMSEQGPCTAADVNASSTNVSTTNDCCTTKASTTNDCCTTNGSTTNNCSGPCENPTNPNPNVASLDFTKFFDNAAANFKFDFQPIDFKPTDFKPTDFKPTDFNFTTGTKVESSDNKDTTTDADAQDRVPLFAEDLEHVVTAVAKVCKKTCVEKIKKKFHRFASVINDYQDDVFNRYEHKITENAKNAESRIKCLETKIDFLMRERERERLVETQKREQLKLQLQQGLYDNCKMMPSRDMGQMMPSRDSSQMMPLRDVGQMMPSRDVGQMMQSRDSSLVRTNLLRDANLLNSQRVNPMQQCQQQVPKQVLNDHVRLAHKLVPQQVFNGQPHAPKPKCQQVQSQPCVANSRELLNFLETFDNPHNNVFSLFFA